jgi:hypothetical protein
MHVSFAFLLILPLIYRGTAAGARSYSKLVRHAPIHAKWRLIGAFGKPLSSFKSIINSVVTECSKLTGQKKIRTLIDGNP